MWVEVMKVVEVVKVVKVVKVEERQASGFEKLQAGLTVLEFEQMHLLYRDFN